MRVGPAFPLVVDEGHDWVRALDVARCRRSVGVGPHRDAEHTIVVTERGRTAARSLRTPKTFAHTGFAGTDDELVSQLLNDALAPCLAWTPRTVRCTGRQRRPAAVALPTSDQTGSARIGPGLRVRGQRQGRAGSRPEAGLGNSSGRRSLRQAPPERRALDALRAACLVSSGDTVRPQFGCGAQLY